MDFNAQVKDFLPTTSNDEVAKDENLPADNLEVIHTALSISNWLQDTGDYTITPSNVDQTVLNEDKSNSNAIDDSKTREFPDVLLDNALSKENRLDVAPPRKVNPESSSDKESDGMVENEDSICNIEQVQHAFVFCTMFKSIEMDSIMAQGIFQSEKEMSQMEENKHSIFYKFSEITFDKDCFTKRKLQATEDVLNAMEINTNEEEFYSSLNVSGIFSFDQNDPIDSWLYNSVENLVGYTISLPVDWVQVVETNKHVKWPLFTSLAINRLEKEKLSIPVSAVQF